MKGFVLGVLASFLCLGAGMLVAETMDEAVQDVADQVKRKYAGRHVMTVQEAMAREIYTRRLGMVGAGYRGPGDFAQEVERARTAARIYFEAKQ